MNTAKPLALVTGGAQRIGKAIAGDLAANGFRVAIHYSRSESAAEDLAGAIKANGGEAFTVKADLRDDSQSKGLIRNVISRAGPISLLVNNASVFHDDEATNLDMANWDDHFAIHLRAPALLIEATVKNLPAGEPGLVVNMIDQRVLALTPRFFSYTLSKSALWTATRTTAQALAPKVRVNAIGPGPTLPNPRQSDDDFRKQVENLPLKRGPSLDEFGRTIIYLWNAPSVTGQMILLDGGQHLAWQTPDVTNIRE